MEISLYNTILQYQKIEYALFDENYKLTSCTPSLKKRMGGTLAGVQLIDFFPELVGYEDTINAIFQRERPALILENIRSFYFEPQNYIRISIYPYREGMLVILQDVTDFSEQEQTVIQHRNELNLISEQLFLDLQRSNETIEQTYETTMEGWAIALELRDYETKGHSRRVIDMTLRLARQMGVSEKEIVHYRRGALLHDIGKMCIPDHILLKNRALSDEEWVVMRKHPTYALIMLSQITFLRPALIIPYCHHERWDGAGYPNGLKGDRIPLEARIFAVADVWDALRSDRPYRQAWSEITALDYIRDQSGTQFDPAVVNAFLKLIGE